MDLPQLTKTYTFLNEILNKYDTFNNPVSNEDVNVNILNLCDNYNTFTTNLTLEQKHTCKKLLRNLLLCNDPQIVHPIKCCSILNFWLYFEMKKYRLSNGIINEIFELSYESINAEHKNKYCAPYDSSNEKLYKSEELIKLGIFIVNEDEFKILLNNKDYLKNCIFKRYFYECVNTYINLNGQSCPEEIKDITYNEDICSILANFRASYQSFLNEAKSKGYELPYLTSPNPYVVDSCTWKETNIESSSTVSNNLNKSISRSVPTAIGTMSAIPPFLALIM
ncbi:hypothetical protein PCYB_004820 [Plasmodium cynomolgi strain B]|uniref:CYIR protein n=1 Tax=Plasmodium cynomolgi (strain B) TaxID=1120755 RepID=K6UNR4_PLACD|nr:hypothetical protein PCYB_004820 [Plasmodium cynomolgi strain B]GAB69733.1 hypothetical protein PCYB_004820 [Plasmodium cynomolgi strain B]